MYDDMVDARNIIEKAGFRASEAIALQAVADELGISKSQLIRLAVLRFLRDRHAAKACLESGLANRTDLGLDSDK